MLVRHDVCRHNCAVESGLVIGFCGQPHYCYRPYYLRAKFRPPSSYVASNHFRTCQCPCHANLHIWGLAQSPSCDRGQRQTMNQIVNRHPLTKFEGGLNLLHKAFDDAVIRMESTATAAVAKYIILTIVYVIIRLHHCSCHKMRPVTDIA